LSTKCDRISLDLEDTAVDKTKFFALAKNSGLKVMEGMLEGRIVVHYQIGKDAVFRLCAVMRQVLPVATGVDV
jgi:threonine aldolase